MFAIHPAEKIWLGLAARPDPAPIQRCAIERITTRTGSLWLAGIVPVVAFALAHVPMWKGKNMKNLFATILVFTALGTLTISVYAAGKPETSSCVRGEPEPLFSLNSPGVKTHSFKMKSPHEAEEEVVFKSHDKLLIQNWGCEYFVNTFHYESENLKGNEADIAYWFFKSAEILKALSLSKPQAVFDFEKTAKTLELKAKDNKGLKFEHEPYAVEDDGIDFLKTQVVVKSGGKLKGGPKSYVEFELSKGPL
jgi:hypothetical protein